jgi:hypothetical protein
VALLCLPCLASELSVGHRLAWEGADEVEEEEEEHAEDGTNNELVNPTVDDGAKCDGGCGRHRAAAVAAVVVRLGHVVSANSVQVYCGVEVRSNKPTDIKLRCMPHHLIDVVDPPVIILVVLVVNDVIILYDTILYS